MSVGLGNNVSNDITPVSRYLSLRACTYSMCGRSGGQSSLNIDRQSTLAVDRPPSDTSGAPSHMADGPFTIVQTNSRINMHMQ